MRGRRGHQLRVCRLLLEFEPMFDLRLFQLPQQLFGNPRLASLSVVSLNRKNAHPLLKGNLFLLLQSTTLHRDL